MILFIARLLTKFFGVDLQKAQRIVFWCIVGLSIVLILALGLWLRSCFKSEPKIDHDAIQKVNSKNKAEARAEVRELVTENLDVVEAVGEQTKLTEVNAVERERKIEEKMAEVDRKIEEAKAAKGDVTQEELKCILVPSNCQ